MSHSFSFTEVPRRSIGDILRRSAVPFFLFSAVLTGLLVLSWFLLLPLFTRVEIAGSLHTLASLRGQQSALKEEIAVAERMRTNALLPVQDPRFGVLQNAEEGRVSFLQFQETLLNIAATTAVQNDAIHVSSLDLEPGTKRIRIAGDVRFVGPRSMTVLAAFIEALEEDPRVETVEMPRFVREEDESSGVHSPFAFSMFLR